jgi:hypothetical protein
MARITKYGAQQMLLSSYAPELANMPETLWFALTVSVPPLEVNGSSLVEPFTQTGTTNLTNYVRAPYYVGSEYWELLGSTTLTNSQDVVWEVPDTDWGTIVGWAICADESGGSVLASGELSSPRFIASGSSVVFPAGSVRLRMEF